MKSETLISLQSNSIVSSGFNRTQWCKIIRSRSKAKCLSLAAEAETVRDIGSFILLEAVARREARRANGRAKKGVDQRRKKNILPKFDH